MSQPIPTLLLTLTMGLTTTLAAPRDIFYPGLRLLDGASLQLTLRNDAAQPDRVEVTVYRAVGRPLSWQAAVVPAAGSLHLAVDLTLPADEDEDLGWVRVSAGHETAVVSAIFELLRDDHLTSLDQDGIIPSASPEAVARALLSGLHHTYTTPFMPGVEAVLFINLSPYPVSAGLCQSRLPDCVATLSRRLGPYEQAYFETDAALPYFNLESTSGVSVARPVHIVDGLTRVFDSSSSVTFEPVPRE